MSETERWVSAAQARRIYVEVSTILPCTKAEQDSKKEPKIINYTMHLSDRKRASECPALARLVQPQEQAAYTSSAGVLQLTCTPTTTGKVESFPERGVE